MMRGTIVKGVGGFYYVKTPKGIYECKARGIFRKDGVLPRVGDETKISVLSDTEGVIEEILPRRNVFIRPPIANVDCLVLVVAVTKPEPNLSIIDKFLVSGEQNHADILLCINKIDLPAGGKLQTLLEIYRDLYPVRKVSGETGEGIPELADFLKGRKSALAGPSGVGKSTLLNQLHGKELAETGGISRKSGRGKHTTRHVELFELPEGGFLFDTPGFTSFDVAEMEEEELPFLFPEIAAHTGNCRYDNCRHLTEPDCRVREAVEQGRIHPSRYRSYEEQMREIQSRKPY